MENWKIGDRVHHVLFGNGTITGFQGKQGLICQFDRLKTTRTILRTFKGLEKGEK